jgi:hypothetical protein
VAEARRLAAAAGVANARFEVADVQVHPFGAGIFDVMLSSLGLMFFVFTSGFAEAAALLGLHEKPGSSAAFSLAGTGRVGALLSGAGFGGIEFAKADEPMLIGRDADDVVMPAAAWLVTAQAV